MVCIHKFKKDVAQWATEYSDAIYSMSQSEEEVKLKALKYVFRSYDSCGLLFR